ncbi:phage major capsid protein [Streptomyces synnematoformans]|uniref:phage major capsid protein n=1 Tax=Streptomyces synnematoformans TaxID=415721 RepID=UPI0031D99784
MERWDCADTLKDAATGRLEALQRDDVKGVAEHVIRYSDPLYVEAFRAFARDPETFAGDLEPEQRRVWASNREYARAALGTAGAVLPSPMDPAITLTNEGVTDPMRQLARVQVTNSKSHRFITSAGSTFSYDAELAEVSDDTFTESEITIETEKAQGYIEASLEVYADQPNFATEVARIIADGKARLDAEMFVKGTGATSPQGIFTELAGTASDIAAAGEALTPDDIYGLIESLPPRWRAAAAWQLEYSTVDAVHRMWNPTGTEPPLLEGGQLLRRPYHENSEFDAYSAVDDTAAGTNRLMVVGDWSQFAIVDRAGTSVHYIPPGVIRGANGRPDGRVGWYCTWRSGSGVLVPNAFRMLTLTTAV